ncbi:MULTISPECIES: DUF3857 domain-containing protein [Dysgonomonas]|uniref:DUF3857 domain-containing protein n=1 Tax=Dysgonomonas gadei ATCC BAA-286 TaxID=742766 RepID=F5IU92_9BACT|nr:MULTISPECIES: DUF3857 domain-containing protein [Dysgonomonas]EGK03271.1 hypothetical protein HMPREF9455_00659 [Dysgonomonas gadei ATCC BAA-286]MBF0649583.1 DUF3857 domain-containing protein [Dysgonomonas sp. GY75]
MKKTIAISFLLFHITMSLFSQADYTQEAGKVTQYEMSMTEYEKDKDAEALVIYDLGKYYFQGDNTRGFLLRMEKRIKIKILKQAGVKYANFEIPYYMEGMDWENIEDIQATTYNFEDGQLKKTELINKNIFEEKINENLQVKKIALADVREGSVIEFSYKVSTPYFFNMRKWDFQGSIPVIQSQLKYRAMPYYEYTYILKGANKLDEMTSKTLNDEIRFGRLVYKEVEYTFGMKDIPAFRDEEFITSAQDYMISLNFQLSKIYYPTGGKREIMTTWPAMCDDFLKNSDFGKYIRNSEKEGKKVIATLDLTDKPVIDKIDIITQYVKSKYNWDGNNGKYAQVGLSDFLKQQKGNVGNINLFLVGLLQAAGVDVYPVVLSTRKNGAISKGHPFQQFFNYVIAMVKVEDKIYFIDATEPLLYFSDLPERCLNIEGLIIKPKSEEWAVIRQKALSIGQKDFTLKILPEEGKMAVDAKYIGTGLNAYKYRTIHLGKDNNLSAYLKNDNNIEVKDDKIEVVPVDRLSKPFVFSFSFDAPLENNNNKLFLNPFCNLSISENPFKQTSRSNLVDMVYIRGDIYRSTIEIPEGYKVEYIPESLSVDDNLIAINYAIERDSSKIMVSAGYNLKQSVYQAKDYNSLKMSFANMIKKFSEMIVLVKE